MAQLPMCADGPPRFVPKYKTITITVNKTSNHILSAINLLAGTESG
jgi:hypothetical protein